MNMSNTEKIDNKHRDTRLDLIKAISICLVLILHIRPVRIISEDTLGYSGIANFILDQIYLISTPLAVPLFILTSLFLLIAKLQSTGIEYCINRCKRLFEIFVFWTTIHISIYYCISFIQSLWSHTTFSWYIPNLQIYQLLSGTSPPLPIVGDSVFYFIVVLIVLTVMTYYFLKIKSHNIKNNIALSLIVLSLVYFEILNVTGTYIAYWRLDNFIVYIPIAYFLFNQQNERIRKKYVLLLYLCFFVFGCQDVLLRSYHVNIGLYARVSIVCGALAVFTSCTNINSLKSNQIVIFLSKFSLGIFAIHKYYLYILTIITVNLFSILGWSNSVLIMGLPIDLQAVFNALPTIILTLATVHLLSYSSLQKFVK